MFTDPSVSTQTQWRLAASAPDRGKSVFTQPVNLRSPWKRNLLFLCITGILAALVTYLVLTRT